MKQMLSLMYLYLYLYLARDHGQTRSWVGEVRAVRREFGRCIIVVRRCVRARACEYVCLVFWGVRGARGAPQPARARGRAAMCRGFPAQLLLIIAACARA